MIYVVGAGPRRARHRRQHLSRRHLQRVLSGRHAGRRRAADPVQAVLLSRRHSQSRRTGDARHRSTRAASSATRCSHAFGAVFDNPEPDRRVRRRRRRGRNRTAGHRLALEQVSEPAPPTAPCCRSCTSTATRSPTRRCWRAFRRDELSSCCAGTAMIRTSSRATTRRRCIG